MKYSLIIACFLGGSIWILIPFGGVIAPAAVIAWLITLILFIKQEWRTQSGRRVIFGAVTALLFASLFSIFFVDPKLILTICFFFAVSIVCSAGISLLVYVPLFYLLGIPAEKLLPAPITKNTTSNLIASEKALQSFISDSRNQGVHFNQISQQLRNAGWDQTVIKKMVELARSN